MINLKTHTVLVTGSTQGVGHAIAVACAQAGAKIVLHGLVADDAAKQSLEACRELGAEPKLITGDLSGSIESGVDAVFKQAIAANPNIDILINNAGIYIDQPFLEMDYTTFDKTMKLNVYAYYFLTQRFAQYWVSRNIAGRVLLIGSINGRLAEQIHTAYDTSKGAVEMMVRTLCVSLAPYKIRVNGLSPGLFYTPLTAPALDQPEVMQWMRLHTPNGEVPGPEVCGEAAVYLVSDAARHVTGQMLLVDGGMSAWQQPDAPAS